MTKLWMHIITGAACVLFMGSAGVAQDAEQPPVDPASVEVDPETEAPVEPVDEVMDPDTLAANHTQARDDYMAGRYLPAIKLYGEILTDFPDDVQAAAGRSLAQQAMGRYDAAIETLSADPAPADAEWLLTRARAFEAVGRYEEALADAKAAYDLDMLWGDAERVPWS